MVGGLALPALSEYDLCALPAVRDIGMHSVACPPPIRNRTPSGLDLNLLRWRGLSRLLHRHGVGEPPCPHEEALSEAYA